MKKILLFIPLSLIFAGERLPRYGSFTKYPHKVYMEGVPIDKVCTEKAPNPAISVVCMAEDSRYFYDPRPGVFGEDDGVYVNGKYKCTRKGCFRRFENDITDRLIMLMNRKLKDVEKQIFIGIYYYLSDWQKEYFFNAAVQYNQIEVVKAYIDYGIDVNAVISVDDNSGGIITWSAEIKYDTEYSENLYAPLKKQEIFVKKMKPIDAAREYGYTEIVRLLEASGRLE